MAMRDPSPDGVVDSTDFVQREGHGFHKRHFLDALRDHVASLSRAALHIIYPPQCVACEGGTDAPHALCPTCWRDMPFISRPYCARLGTPFAVDFGASMLSPAAIADPPRFDVARAVALHDGVAKELVSRFKYGERLDLARFMAPLMVKAGQEMLTEAQVLVPVPMHPRRLFIRRYNQAALLAQAIGKETGIAVSLDALRRARHTPQQVGLNRAERRSNLAGAFRLAPEAEMVFAGTHAVLIDDVRTTGATLNACAHMLRKAGAKRVDVLTFTLVPDQGIIG